MFIVNLQNLRIIKFVSVTESFQEIVPGILPFFHIYGLTVILHHTLCYGCKIVTMPKFEPKLFENVLKQYKVSKNKLLNVVV